MSVLKKVTARVKVAPKVKITPRVKITGPGGRSPDLSGIMHEELHRLVGEHKLAAKKGASKKLASRLMQKIESVTYCLQAMSWDLDE